MIRSRFVSVEFFGYDSVEVRFATVLLGQWCVAQKGDAIRSRAFFPRWRDKTADLLGKNRVSSIKRTTFLRISVFPSRLVVSFPPVGG